MTIVSAETNLEEYLPEWRAIPLVVDVDGTVLSNVESVHPELVQKRRTKKRQASRVARGSPSGKKKGHRARTASVKPDSDSEPDSKKRKLLLGESETTAESTTAPPIVAQSSESGSSS